MDFEILESLLSNGITLALLVYLFKRFEKRVEDNNDKILELNKEFNELALNFSTIGTVKKDLNNCWEYTREHVGSLKEENEKLRKRYHELVSILGKMQNRMAKAGIETD